MIGRLLASSVGTMKLRPIAVATVLTALALAATPAFADNHERGAHTRSGGGDSRARSDERAAPRAATAPREERREGPRAEAAVPRAVPRAEVIRPRVERPVVIAPRGERPIIVSPRVQRSVVVAPRIITPRYYYGYPAFRPYLFRPRLRLNFGVFVGYPVPFYAYPYPVPVYGYAAPVAPVVVGPGSTSYGAVTLEMTPGDAAVYVDGAYAGVVSDFDGTRQPLTLAAGTHRIEVQEPGYQPLVFDVAVQPGQVTPYRGELLPQ
jgi:hypothetical protein